MEVLISRRAIVFKTFFTRYTSNGEWGHDYVKHLKLVNYYPTLLEGIGYDLPGESTLALTSAVFSL